MDRMAIAERSDWERVRIPSRETGSNWACGAKLGIYFYSPNKSNSGTIHDNSGSLVIVGTINEKPCDMTIDTGSDISMVIEDVLSCGSLFMNGSGLQT